MREDVVSELAMKIRTGGYLGLDKLDPEGDYEDVLQLADMLYDILMGLGWTPPTSQESFAPSEGTSIP